ncbi:MAG: aminopeptidase [Candidatus Omnitrophica bacterium]|nr:aminopeptidase [Candidatus Omnitrophota bacterium]
MQRNIAETIIKVNLGYKKGEELLVVCDNKLHDLAYGFYKESLLLGCESIIMEMVARDSHGEEPPRTVATALKNSDLAVLFTSMSLSHTKTRKIACHKYGVRIASLPGATGRMLERTIPVNYSSLKNSVKRVTRLLTKGKKVEVRTGNGTNLTMSIEGRKGFPDNGLYVKGGSFGNLPAGEACIAPREGTTNGRLIIDGSAPFMGRIKRPIEIIIKNGYARDIASREVRTALKSFGKAALNVAELGIGLNPRAIITGNILEDEKAKNTAHIAFGNNKSFGGKISCPSHLDFVFLKPLIKIDGVKI